MFSLKGMNPMFSSSSMFTTYASVSASIMLFKTIFNQFVPIQVQSYIVSKIKHFLFKSPPNRVTFIVEDGDGMTPNIVYDACETYLCTKISPNAQRLKIFQGPRERNLRVKFAECEKIIDSFEGLELQWKFIHEKSSQGSAKIGGEANLHHRDEKKRFELSFDKQHRDKVLGSYLPFVVQKAKAIKAEKKVVKLHTLSQYPGAKMWDSINLQHPSTFDTLAMDPDLKKAVIDDLDRFVERKDFYKKVGKAWKRGYLLYGPPGTGKSSLVAAMANYLKFDVYDLQLMNSKSDSSLRKIFLATGNRSILVIEDIDCSVELPDRELVSPAGSEPRKRNPQFTLSGLLNFIDGLWSSCGDERIIIFTTNNKEKLDPALLRPGRMDMHIHMSYCTFHGFKFLASNYLDIHGGCHRLYPQIEELIATTNVTPAEVAEELMKSNDADVSLEGLIGFLELKRTESHKTEDEGKDGIEFQEADKLQTPQTPKLSKKKKIPQTVAKAPNQ
ncbi:AAA-ATPase At5g17750-like [Cornus florida]|uniref:AAA-ATPase At5g17750-like n=1 Tax=Cornus florida TaxID=4283 RepID=UPI00289F767A|nr:AAA-ATPase At5g17750-like [Cornus florida]